MIREPPRPSRFCRCGGEQAEELGDRTRAAREMEAYDAAQTDPATAHFVDCQRFRGDILDHRGDWTAAQRAYAQAVELAPDLPAGYYSWGVALARHGDLAGALAKYDDALKYAPSWAALKEARDAAG